MQSYVVSVEQADSLPLGATSQKLMLLLAICSWKLLVLHVRSRIFVFALPLW